MTQSNEYPRIVYKQADDGPHEVWGHKVHLREVADEDELSGARKDGFKLRPDGHDAEPKAEKPKAAAPVSGSPIAKDPAPDA